MNKETHEAILKIIDDLVINDVLILRDSGLKFGQYLDWRRDIIDTFKLDEGKTK